MKIQAILRGALLPLSLSALSACSGGSNAPPPPPTFDLTGHWMTWFQDPTSMEETGPSGSFIMQNGSTINGLGLTGTASGDTFTGNVVLPGLPATITLNGAVTSQTVLGTFTVTGISSLTGNFRMQQFVPTGTLVASGTVQGLAVAVNSTTAFCRRGYADIGLTSLVDMDVSHDDGSIRFELGFDPATLGVGAIDAGSVPISVYVFDDFNEADLAATSGTVDVVLYDASGFAATFNLTLPGGDTVTGSFDVTYDIDGYDP